jgi:hypothetical protein
MTPKWWARPLSPLMRLGLGWTLKRALEEFKHWAETGDPHPRKAAHSEKNATWRIEDFVRPSGTRLEKEA